MRQLTEKENQILQRHIKFLCYEDGGALAKLAGANLRGANLRGVNLSVANLRGANLRGADLRGADLRGANLRGANLRGADLRGADLRGANLHGANLRMASLRMANLRMANLRGADLCGADLCGADLCGADLCGAILYRTDYILAIGPIGSRKDFTYAVKHTDCIMISCGCFWGDLDTWIKQCYDTHGENKHGKAYAAAAEFIRAYAAAYWQE